MMRIKLNRSPSLFLWLLPCLFHGTFGFGQGDMESREEITFNIRTTGTFGIHVGRAAVYRNEPVYLPVILSKRFQSNVEIPPSSQAALVEAYGDYKRLVGEYFILQSQGIAEKKDRSNVDEQIKKLVNVIDGLPRTVVARASDVATAREVILECLKHPEVLDYEQVEFLRKELATIEKKAYERLLSHCTDEQKKSFDALVLSCHPHADPLPSILHDQLVANGAFDNSVLQTSGGFLFTQACSVAGSENTGVGSRAEAFAQDVIYLIGMLSDQSKSEEVCEMFLKYESDRSRAQKADERLDLLRKFKTSVFAALSDSQAKELKEMLFGVHIRRFGIFAWESCDIDPPVSIKPVFLPDSLEKIKSHAPEVAVEIRKSVNSVATMILQSISKKNLPSLIELNYPIPIEILLGESAP